MQFEGCTFSLECGLPFDFHNPPKNQAIIFAVKCDDIVRFTADETRHVHPNFKLESNTFLPDKFDCEFFGTPIALFLPNPKLPTVQQQAEQAINGSSSTLVTEPETEEQHDPTRPESWTILIAGIDPITRGLLQRTIVSLWNLHASLSVQLESHLQGYHKD